MTLSLIKQTPACKTIALGLALSLSLSAIAKDISSIQYLAMQGDRFSQYELASAYYVGKGVEQNYSQALEWYKKSG
ncbi:SEL1-like repeat protein [Psychrobacter sp. JCM 18900]|uniref:SEL1-like repeat protein n=1 Tax=Psychrobacter sp. JCM 18900 TaxID=1298608 RepID=UPI000436717A|nr:SEL1-like repeat protein [Psychrobacter sp. JCM 18900]GAF53270.1 hypothetical protein JCM18900_11833 [Psychrobacter sp. JCM 18900]